MVFNSIQFLLFLPLVVLVYYLVPQRGKKLWLLFTSYYFYICWHPTHMVVLLFVTAVAYLGGRLVAAARHTAVRRAWLAGGVVLAFLPLLTLKYLNFLVDSCLVVLARLGIQIAPPAFSWLLPMGISFYTLQAVGYLIDVYRGEPAEKSPLQMALFVAFFPQLVSGPISRGKSLLAQFHAPRKLEFDNLRDGVLLMIWGYFLKVVIADRAAIFVDTVYYLDNGFDGWFYIVATLLFGVQLYCDFSGCTTVAMGAAKVLGIDLIDNFQAPYLSRSNAEFWRRWHISLSTWFRDYLYIPPGRQPQGQGAQISQRAHHLCGQRPVARRPVDLCSMGPAQRPVPGHRGLAAPGAQGPFAGHRPGYRYPGPQGGAGTVHLCLCESQLGILPRQSADGFSHHPQRHLHGHQYRSFV